jgi:branched-chain amino acid transport system substrate-binding protein
MIGQMHLSARAMRALFGVLAAALLAVSTPPAGAAAPYEINAILSLTGGGAFLGKEEQEALAVVEARVNADGGIGGRPIHFAIGDDQSNPRTAVELASQLIADRVPVILGSSLSALCSAMVPMVKDGPLLYCFSPGIRPVADSYVFSASFSTRDLIAVSVRYLRLRGLKRIGLITSTDTTGQEAERGVNEAAALPENAGEQIVAREHFNPSDISADAQLTRVKASGAQVVIAWSTGSPVGTLLRAANDVGLTVPVLTSNGNLTYAQMKQYGGFLPSELLFPAGPSYAPDKIDDRATKAAVAKYLALFAAQNVRPDNGQALAFDPAQLVVDALRRIGTGATAAQLRADIGGQRNWIGVNGSYDFKAHPQRGLGESGVVMVRWDAARDTWVGVSRPGGAPL